MTPEERAQQRVDLYNARHGIEDAWSGINCPICKNRGDIMELERRGECLYERIRECECMERRRSVRRIRDSGLGRALRSCTFETFEAREAWQTAILDTARRYVAEGADAGAWFYVGGQPGCGKTHICTAIAGELLKRWPLRYVTWPAEVARIKATFGEDGAQAAIMRQLAEVRALYIDDFFKPYGGASTPSAADVRIAYELINARYIRQLPTIISSEHYLAELMEIDEAVGGRIAERSRGFCLTVGRERAKNQRLK